MITKILVSFAVLLSVFGAVSILLPSTKILAANAADCSKENTGFLGFPTWYKFLEPNFDGTECNLTFPVNEDGEQSIILALPRILLAVFEIILRISGLAAVGFVIYGGIQYILSQGEPEKTKASKNTIVNALVGLVIAMFATAIVNLIGNSIT